MFPFNTNLNWSCEGILPTVRRSKDEFLECVLLAATSVLEAVEFFREQLLPFRAVLPFGNAVFTAKCAWVSDWNHSCMPRRHTWPTTNSVVFQLLWKRDAALCLVECCLSLTTALVLLWEVVLVTPQWS